MNVLEGQGCNMSAEARANPTEALILSGRESLRAGRWVDALEVGRTAEQLGAPYALVIQAQALLALERYDEAVSRAAKAVEANPREPKAWTAYAYAELALGDRARAATLMSRAARLAPWRLGLWSECLWALAGAHTKAVTALFAGLAGASVALTAVGMLGLAAVPTILVAGMSLALAVRMWRRRVSDAVVGVWLQCIVATLVAGFYLLRWLANW